MLFLREILLLAVILSVCWETGDNSCGVECDEFQRGLPQPTCYIRDDGTSTDCRISTPIEDTEIRRLGSFDKLTLMLDLQKRVNRLHIDNSNSYFYNPLKVSTFRFHRKITSLIISNFTIHPGMLVLLPNLKFLRMGSVSFEYFPYLAGANRLTYLSIYSFDIPSTTNSILGGHLSGLTRLKHLYLSPTQYINTTDQSFTGLTALTYLYIESFHIPNPVTTLSPFVRLRKLRLHSCELTDMSFLTRTPSLYGLTYLDLGSNLITRIQPGIFSGYTNLEYLLLYSNRIAQLECGAFTGLNNLEILYLISNPIQNICFTAFKGLESLAGLNLGATSLTSLSSRMFEYLHSLRYIYLSDTPLHCDCNLQWLSRVQHNFGLVSIRAVCASPSEHINKAATNLSTYNYNCTQDLSYQCFNRSISCPSGTSCQDTLDTYLCVCQQEGDLFVRSLNRCVSSEEISNGLLRLGATTPTSATSPTSTSPTSTSPTSTSPTSTSPTSTSPTSTSPTATSPTATSPTATCPSCPTSTCATCPTATCPSCPTTTCPTCPTTAAPTF